MKLMSEATKERIESRIVPKEVPKRLGVHRVTVYQAMKKVKATGSARRRPGQGQQEPLLSSRPSKVESMGAHGEEGLF